MSNYEFSNLEGLIKEQYGNIAGIVIVKNGDLAYESYFNGYTPDDAIHIASVTKSITSSLVGIAIDKGYINNINQKVLEFFSNYNIKRGEKTIQRITIRELMTMTAPYKFRAEPYAKVYSSEDWTKAALDLLGGKDRSGKFKYSTIGTHILSGILVSATGETVLDFATKNLFNPLGIQSPDNRMIQNKEAYFAFLKDKYVKGWVVDFNGVNTAGWGLTLKPRDMAKFGQLYLNKGMWNGTQILSSKWVADSTEESSRWGDLPYGYLWWIIKDNKSSGYAALGDGGNIIYVCPDKELVVAIASSFKPRAKDRVELIRKHIVPLV